MELAGFEPVTPSLRKMQSKPSDQGKRLDLVGLWRGCGTSHVRQGETSQAFCPRLAYRSQERSVSWFGQPLVSYQVAQASRLSTMRLAHSGERADAQPASAYSSASSPPSANSLKLSRSSVSSG